MIAWAIPVCRDLGLLGRSEAVAADHRNSPLSITEIPQVT